MKMSPPTESSRIVCTQINSREKNACSRTRYNRIQVPPSRLGAAQANRK
jgi:hypothetical protein